MGSRYRPSAPMVAFSVTMTVVTAFLGVAWFALTVVLIPFARWYWRNLRNGWADYRHRRTLLRARRQTRLPRRQRQRIAAGDYDDPSHQLALRSVWWCLWLISHEIPAWRVAELMRDSRSDWADVVGFVAAQAHTIPTRHPEEITAATWATELRALHDLEPLLPRVLDQ